MSSVTTSSDALATFHPAVRRWFEQGFTAPTSVQAKAWPTIARGAHTLLLAPTGSGKTLAAFLVAIDRMMFGEWKPESDVGGVRVLYISPLKALGVDIERNLRAPLAGVRAVAERQAAEFHLPRIAVRSGDTEARERYRMTRQPPDILITTPESLYLMLTAQARKILRTVETVIVDEIHTMVASKRGAHLFVSLERLERLRREEQPCRRPMQRIGLSATQRPLAEVARLLGGAEAKEGEDEPAPRPVQIVEAGCSKQLQIRIEVPVEDMARLGDESSGPAASGPTLPSIWPAIHPRLVELIGQHRSTMIFVNSRRLAERLSAAINELAEKEIAAAHHGSIARDQRRAIEDRLKRGQLPAIVATSSLELGIDMGAVDLVIQIEAPPSIASGIQRIGRAGHQVDATSSGVIFPKYRGDLLAASAAVERMHRGEVEESFYPRNPLDLLAQQVVAMVATETVAVEELYATLRCAAPFHELPRSAFEGVLDLLAGRYPSDEFAALRPRLHWDRIAGQVSPRRGAQRVAIANAGTIPDRGLYGVFLSAGAGNPGSRVGELDEEMVFETRAGDVFLLGASSWRVLEITHDRVLVAPAPGEPGRMPFWRGDGPGRPLEFGRAIGSLARRLVRMPAEQAEHELTTHHGLDPRAASNLLKYLREQADATSEVPSDKTIVVESFVDEVGDWRVVILSPLGARVHAPWATAVGARLRQETLGEVDLMWSDDGMVFRLPESDNPPPTELLFPASEEVEQLVVRELGTTALFAAHFRENAARALLLPRRQPGRRTPLWLQRRRSADLLKVAARYERFPILLETYRECLRDVLDLPGLKQVLADVERRSIRVHTVVTQTPSPFAASLIFSYTANFLYEGDAPLAERRAQTLALDHNQLRELLGDAELRELLEADVVDELALELQRLTTKYAVRHADALHDLLLSLGDLTFDEILARCDVSAARGGNALDVQADGSLPAGESPLQPWLTRLIAQRRIVEVTVGGESRFIAAEDAARYRDALGVVPPSGLPDAFLTSVAEPLVDLVSRYARTHAPFKTEDAASRLGLGVAPIRSALLTLQMRDRVLEGEFLPGGRGREWCDANVLRTLKRRSLARLRKEVQPVDPEALARFLLDWQGIHRPRRGLDGLLDVIEQLQGASLPASVLESEILPARIENYRGSDLDELAAAGEVVWRGHESLGSSDGRIALYLTDHFNRISPAPAEPIEDPAEQQIHDLLAARGALFFDEITRALGGFRNDVLDAVWRLVWAGYLTNDTLAPLRSLRREASSRRRSRRQPRPTFRSRRQPRLSGSEGRWSLLRHDKASITATERQAALATQLLDRYGVLTREIVASEGAPGGFAAMYPVLKAMEEAGRVRRGYFVAGQGAAQFAVPGAEDSLRQQNQTDGQSSAMVLAATDPANPYGAALRWPETTGDTPRPMRAAGARVVLHDGRLVGHQSRSGQHLLTFLPESEPERGHAASALAAALASKATGGAPLFLAKIDGQPVAGSELAARLLNEGFVPIHEGYVHRGTVTA